MICSYIAALRMATWSRKCSCSSGLAGRGIGFEEVRGLVFDDNDDLEIQHVLVGFGEARRHHFFVGH